jgi:exopolysaccharide biosynthesis protein
MYTISEIKIAHPSQFRRFVSDGDYYSTTKYTAVEMAAAANAVVAANGDFYTFRTMGIIVYDSKLMRADGWGMDSCLMDKNGDLHFIRRRQLIKREDIQAYVDEHGVRFSLAFGPILVEDGKVVVTDGPYPVSEGNERWPRGSLSQHGKLHYVLVAANQQGGHVARPTNVEFAQGLLSIGLKNAYNLDGGQSATIVMNDQRINLIWLRQISDIIYFATAIPDGD